MATRRLGILLGSALVLIAIGVALWAAAGTRSLTAAERDAVAKELISGIRISTNVSDTSLAATKALVDFLPENDVRLVRVRIVDDLDLDLRIETDHAVALSALPSFCLVGPYSAPDDGGFSSPCWGAPEIGERLVAQLNADSAGHAVLPAGRAITIALRLSRVEGRCDYPPGRWLLRVEVDPVVGETPMGARALPDVAFDVPYLGTGPLQFIPVNAMRYCGLANVVYREQGEPEVASPTP
jgi:hypothetical protein